MWPITTEGWSWIDGVKSLSLIAAFPYRVWKVVPPGWTIHIEVCFYAAIAIGYALCDRLTFRSTAVRWYCFAWLAVYVAISCSVSTRFENATGFIPFFVVGIALHRLTMGSRGFGEVALLVAASILSMNSILHWNNVENLSIFAPWAEVSRTFPTVRTPATMIAMPIMVLLLFWSLNVEIPKEWRRVDRLLGDLTYPMYATHFLVLAVVGSLFPSLSGKLQEVIQLPAVLVFAYLINCYLERPLYPLRDRFRGASYRPEENVHTDHGVGTPQIAMP
jgi:peptidoglycan/LPS O-acetylase OafA/YrhL